MKHYDGYFGKYKLLKEKEVLDYAFKMRIIQWTRLKPEYKHLKETPFWVQLNYENNDDDWGVFGGSVGMRDSTFKTYPSAKQFYDDVGNLSDEEMLKKYPDLWVE